MDMEHIVYHAAMGEDYDVALFVHAMREKAGTHNAPIDKRTLSNMMSNECYQEVQSQALAYAVRGQGASDAAKRDRFNELDKILCSFARRLRNNGWKSQYIKEYMECFA